jgi:hypothetical protein
MPLKLLDRFGTQVGRQATTVVPKAVESLI